MIKSNARKMSNHGFTLIEVIVTIIAAGILGAIFINFMGTAMSRSARSLENVQGEADAESVLRLSEMKISSIGGCRTRRMHKYPTPSWVTQINRMNLFKWFAIAVFLTIPVVLTIVSGLPIPAYF